MYTHTHAKNIISHLESGLNIGSTQKIVNRWWMDKKIDKQKNEWVNEAHPTYQDMRFNLVFPP